MADKAQDTAGGDSERRDATQRRRVADRILHKNLRLNEILLDSLPHPAMLIRKDRMILAANHIARQLGAKVGAYCWRSFGQSEFIGEQDKQYINDHKQVPPGGTHCVFCKADEALEKKTQTGNPEVKAWDKIWDMHWIGLDEETFLHYAIDVTHISREDERLRMSEIKYRTLAQNIPGLVYRILAKQDNRMMFFNTMLETMTGFKESELEKGEVCSVEPHILAEDRDKVAAAVKHACDEKEPFEVEYRFKHKNGDIKWFKEIGRPLFGPGDELLFIDGIITDITVHKRAEEALAESEGRFRALFEQAAVGVSQVETKTGRFLKVNRKYCDIVGYSPEEMMSRTFQEITHPEDLPKDLDNMKKLVKGDIREFSMEKRYLHKSGAIVWVSLSVSAMWGAGEEPNWHIAVIEDITERKQAEDALRDKEEKWRSLAKTAPVVIMNVSRDGNISFINRPIDRYTLEEVIGTRVYDYLPQGQHDTMRKSLERVFETGKPDSFEILGEGPEGPATGWYENHIGPILDQNGKVANVTMVAINITERKRIEKVLKSERDFTETALNTQEDTFFVFEPSTGKACRWNKAFSEISGYSDDEIRSMKAPDSYYSQDDLKKAASATEKILKGETVVIEMSLITKDGKSIPTEYAGSVIKDDEGNPRYIIALGRDITERKRAEEKLRLLSSAVEQSSEGVGVVDMEGNLLYVNSAFADMHGYTEEELAGKQLSIFHTPEQMPAVDESNKQTKETGEFYGEVWHKRQDGTVFPSLMHNTILRDDNDEPIGIIGTALDITERKLAEEKIRLERDKLKGLFEGLACAEIGIDVVGTDYKIHLQNSILEQRFGDLTGKLCYEEYMGLKEPCEFCPMIKAVRNNKVESVELTAKDGRDYELLSAPLPNPDGTVDKAIEVVRDITERKRAEEALRDGEEKWRSLTSNTNDIILILDIEGNILYTNRVYPPHEMKDVVGHSIFEFMSEESNEVTQESIKKLLRGEGPQTLETAVRLSESDTVQFEVKYVPMLANGEVDKIIAVAYDITERKEAKEQLRSSEEKYRVLFEGHAEPVTILDRDGIVLMVNSAGARNIGLSQEESVGKSIFEVLPGMNDSLHEVYQQVIDTGISVTREDFLELPSGHRWFWSVHQPVSDINGTRYGVQIISYDITERKQAETERERLMEELDATNKELQSIVYTTSHDLQTPLVNIKGFGGELGKYCGQLNALLESKTAGKDTERQIETLLNEDIPEAIKLINAGTDKMRSLLDGLMYLSRVGETDLNISSLDMNHLMKNVQRTMEYLIKEKGATVTIEKLPECMGDARQIDRVFGNLLDNALKYLEPGRKGQIHISGRVEKGMSIYCVEDNGIGIAPEHRDKVFEIFYRLDAAAPLAGEGLGLTIVERILDRNNGRVCVESELGRGSKFFMSLPHAKLS